MQRFMSLQVQSVDADANSEQNPFSKVSLLLLGGWLKWSNQYGLYKYKDELLIFHFTVEKFNW